MNLERWQGKVAFVTGVSSGIGFQIVKDLVKEGLIVVGVARRLNKLRELEDTTKGKGRFYSLQCDVTKEAEVKTVFSWVKEQLGGVDILINNAGAAPKVANFITDSDVEDWKRILDTNVLAMAMCTRESLKTMRTRGDDGIIININSISGHDGSAIYFDYPITMYVVSKHGVTAFCKSLREELKRLHSNIRVTSLSPGLVKSGMTEELIDLANPVHLLPEDISYAVLYILGTRQRTQIAQLTIMPVGQEGI